MAVCMYVSIVGEVLRGCISSRTHPHTQPAEGYKCLVAPQSFKGPLGRTCAPLHTVQPSCCMHVLQHNQQGPLCAVMGCVFVPQHSAALFSRCGACCVSATNKRCWPHHVSVMCCQVPLNIKHCWRLFAFVPAVGEERVVRNGSFCPLWLAPTQLQQLSP